MNNKRRKIYLGMAMVCISGLLNPINPANAESAENKIKIEKQSEDINEIPDKYNSGVNMRNAVMTTYNGESTFIGKKGDEDVEITLKHSEDEKYMFNFVNGNNRNLSGDIVVRNMDFSNYQITTSSENLVNNKLNIIFENCKFNYIVKEKLDSNVKFTFNYCSLVRFSGSGASFDRCAFGGTHMDPLIPFRHVTVKNSLISDISKPADDGAHIDGTQIYGVEVDDKDAKVKVQKDSIDINFDNCRFEVPGIKFTTGDAYVNACIMIQLEYSDGHDISFKNCIANGGSSTIYAHAVKGTRIDNVSLENIKIGGAMIYNPIYSDIDDNVVLKDISATDSLYIGSVFKRNDGKTVFSVTNDTIIERKLKIITDTGVYDFTVKAGPDGADYKNPKYTSYEQMPFDEPKTIEGDIKYAVCLDVTNPEFVKQIRFINYTNQDIYIDKSYFGGDEVLNNNVLLSGSCGKNVSFVLTKDGVITISGEGDMKDFHSKDLPPWYDYMGIIRKVIIEEGVTSIGNQAFNKAFAVEDVVIADTVERIGKRTFAGCASLININFPENLKIIIDDAFDGVRKCVYQKSEEVKTDEKGGADADKKSNVSNTSGDVSKNSEVKDEIKVGMIIKDNKTGFVYKVTSIKGTPELSLIKCSKQKKTIKVKGSVKLLNRKFMVTSIAKNAFRYNKKVKTIYIDKGVKKILKGAFKKCKKLRKIVVKNKKFTKKYLSKRGLSKKVKVIKK